MTEFLTYGIKAAILLALFLAFYRILLRKEAFHAMNRCVLLSSVLLSFILPLVTITRTVVVSADAGNTQPTAGEGIAGGITETLHDDISWTLAGIIYIAGTAISLAAAVAAIIRVRKLVRNGERKELGPGIRLTVTEKEISPFSWFGNIVMSRKDYEEDYGRIIRHETAHIAKGHTYDNLLMTAACILQWFNPAVWMLRNDLTDIHEFEADKAVTDSGENIKEYQLMLIRKAVGRSSSPIANSFNHSTLKKRITMMSKKQISRWGAWKALYVILLSGFALAANAETRFVSGKDTENSVTDKSYTEETVGKVYEFNEIETAPKFMDGDYIKFTGWLMEHINYPKEWIEQKKEGKIVIGFTISKTGKITDVTVLRGTDPAMDNAVADIIKSSPDWTPAMVSGQPVNVRMALPVTFSLK